MGNKVKILTLLVFLCFITGAPAFSWTFNISNETDEDVRVKVIWASIFCRNDDFTLNRRTNKSYGVGICDLQKIFLNDGLAFQATENPTNGVKIVKDGNGKLILSPNPN